MRSAISHDIICGGHGKNLSGFRNFITYVAYKWKHLRRRIRELRNDTVKFGVKVTIEFWFDFKFFFYSQ